MNRRQLLYRTAAGLITGAAAPPRDAPAEASFASTPLALSDYAPRNMLQIPVTRVERSRYPTIDIHTHITGSLREESGVPLGAERSFSAEPEELLPVMDQTNIQAMVNLTGGYDAGLKQTLLKYDSSFKDRFYTFTEPAYDRVMQSDYAVVQASAIEQAHHDGARGLKVLKTLGLYLRDQVTHGKLIAIDDARFDPMWDACGRLNMPVAIHVSDPIAFFQPTDRFNERYEELTHHPDWSFCKPGFPKNEELLAARDRVIARHPNTQFIVLHVGNFAESLSSVGASMRRFPNMNVDIAARIGELGRQPRNARRFFDEFQDRILFGTDATPHADNYPQQVFGDKLYQIYYRFLETDDECFDYAPANVPPQGRWQISGINLPDSILKKVYNRNAARELHLAV